MLTDFLNYFTTEKGIKFPTNPAIFHHILHMFPHYLAEIKSSNLLLSATDKLNKKLSYRRGTARCVVSVEMLPTATQQCRNYLYDKS